MDWQIAFLLLMGTVLAPMFLGVPVALAFFGANIVGAVVFFGGEAGLAQMARNAYEGLINFSLSPIPMFVLMGEIMFQTGVAFRAIDAIDRLITRVPGRLSLVAVSCGTVFSALSGSSMANTALLGGTLMPEMTRRGYHPGMALGPILGSGGLAMLIPPSSMAVLLGSMSGISITGILLGGILPALLIAAFYVVYIVLRCTIDPSLAPAYPTPKMRWSERVMPFLVYVLPLMSLFVVVVGSILTGIATPTESAALGAIGATVAAACYRCLTWRSLHKALVQTGKITVTIFFIIAASLTFSQILAFSGATGGILSLLNQFDLTPLVVVVGMLVIVLALGCLMDPLSIILITLPFFIPLVRQVGIEPVWFGVLMLVALEVGQTTPPFGLLLFTMKSVAPESTTMRQVYLAAAPFTLMQILAIALIVFFPALGTWLPSLSN
ncbi:TRAP transporter large permease [Arenibaculum sp.]|jgi:tripartite ATP-independent transporter DctM subunit|uniref:TRAP transporter large permease n=1 Tax=Arenibaculum sp. TaxID=2865862 RepID=UPI002E161489|nr:TRAP transporter large permease [Arenibaculum sp.]